MKKISNEELNILLQQEKDKYIVKVQLLEESNKYCDKQLVEKKGEIQDLKQKIDDMEKYTKWKKQEIKRKFKEEKEKLANINKDIKNELDISTTKYETQLEALKSQLEKQGEENNKKT